MRSPRQWTKRRWLVVLALIIAVPGAPVLIGLWLYHSNFGSWKRNQRFLVETRPDELRVMATTLEGQILRLQSYQGPLPGERQAAAAPKRGDGEVDATPDDRNTRTIRVPIDRINAWLATKLPKWLANRKWEMPEQVSQPTVWIDGHDLVLGFRWESPEISNVFSIALAVEATDAGLIRLRRKKLFTGRLPVPFESLLRRIEERTLGANRRMIEWMLESSDGRPHRISVPYGGDATRDMKLRLVDVQLDNEAIELTFVVEPARPDDRGAGTAPRVRRR